METAVKDRTVIGKAERCVWFRGALTVVGLIAAAVPASAARVTSPAPKLDELLRPGR